MGVTATGFLPAICCSAISSVCHTPASRLGRATPPIANIVLAFVSARLPPSPQAIIASSVATEGLDRMSRDASQGLRRHPLIWPLVRRLTHRCQAPDNRLFKNHQPRRYRFWSRPLTGEWRFYVQYRMDRRGGGDRAGRAIGPRLALDRHKRRDSVHRWNPTRKGPDGPFPADSNLVSH